MSLKKQCKGLHTASWEEISYGNQKHSLRFRFPVVSIHIKDARPTNTNLSKYCRINNPDPV